MAPASILAALWADGITVDLIDGDLLLISPASALTNAQRDSLKANKPAVLTFLHEAEHIATALMEVAMRACHAHGDGPAARAEMQADCLATPPHLCADLLDHFRASYPPKETRNG
ncbi:MAG: hypothetical protein EON56_06150 [Alphaproteobacteria bacterium]|nr:MAG: hypothetical protein EON56_06150 [Alphaproteobacteria bacterium]